MFFDENKLKQELARIIEKFKVDIKKINTGKASVDVLENIYVEAYGSSTPLSGVGNIIVQDAITIKISVWDKNIFKAVENAIRDANIGANVATESDFIRLKFNPLTQEDRKDRVKRLGAELEEAKIAIRQVRQKFMKDLSVLDSVSEDDKKRDEEKVQKIIDEAIKELEEIAKQKEISLMSI